MTPRGDPNYQLAVEPRLDSDISLDLFGASDLVPRPSFTWNDIHLLGADSLPATSPLDPARGLSSFLPGYSSFPSFTLGGPSPLFPAAPQAAAPRQPVPPEWTPSAAPTPSPPPAATAMEVQQAVPPVPPPEKPKPPSRSRERNRE